MLSRTAIAVCAVLLVALGLFALFRGPQNNDAVTANVRPVQTTSPAKPPAPVKFPFNSARAQAHQTDWATFLGIAPVTKTSQGLRMVLIPPGEFWMGAKQAEVDAVVADTNLRKVLINNAQGQLPQHRVRLTRPFRLAATEVTHAQFGEFVADAQYKTDAERDGK